MPAIGASTGTIIELIIVAIGLLPHIIAGIVLAIVFGIKRRKRNKTK